MSQSGANPIRVAIACGGTGGHLFPGLAVAGQLIARGCAVTLLISPKEVDQAAVKQSSGMDIVTLPAVGLTRRRVLAFVKGFGQSYAAASQQFKARPPQAALAMGGFTSAPPILAAKRLGAPTFLHDSNTIPGRANRWLSWMVDQAFVGFPSAARRLHAGSVSVTGTPVRPQFQPVRPGECRRALGLDPDRPVVLVMGGSQGASGINELVIRTLPLTRPPATDWQWFHLSGPADADQVRQAYAAAGLKAIVHPFFAAMELALSAATVAISRAGASSLAELAAMRLPAVLVPFPAATDNHQFFNARAFEESGAARLLPQKSTTPEALRNVLQELVGDAAVHGRMQSALGRWHAPRAAEEIAEAMLRSLGKTAGNYAAGRSGDQERTGSAAGSKSAFRDLEHGAQCVRPVPPHPCPLPRGEGGGRFGPSDYLDASAFPCAANRFSLSLGERAGVRGNGANAIPPASKPGHRELLHCALAWEVCP